MLALSRSSAIRFERRKFDVKIHNNPFSGPPRPELDAAWHELFESVYQPFAMQTETRGLAKDRRYKDASSTRGS